MPVPGRIDAALSWIYHSYRVRHPSPEFDGQKPEPEELTAREQKVEDAALKILLDYFECKADFGDDPSKLSLDEIKKTQQEEMADAK